MRKRTILYIILIFTISFHGCDFSSEKSDENENGANTDHNSIVPLVEKVFTAEEQAALTPDMVIELFKAGNQRFMNNDLTARNHSEQVRNSTFSQFPKAIVLSCIDSRIPVEDVLDKGIGDLFVARVAGNFVNTDILGSMEYACKVSGAKIILVLGHEHCGAIKSAIDNVKLGNITEMLSNIRPAVESLSDFAGDKTSDNENFVHAVCEQNVKNAVAEIRLKSPILKEMEDNGEIKIVGAIYNMTTGGISLHN